MFQNVFNNAAVIATSTTAAVLVALAIAGNGAAVKWTGRGVSKAGRKVQFEGIDVFEINEAGKIQTVHAYWNPAEMVAQL